MSDPTELPAHTATVAAFAREQLDLVLPPETLVGVAANLAALREHWRRLDPGDGGP